MSVIKITNEELHQVFTEWNKRESENPERFMSKQECDETEPEDLASLQAGYFMDLLASVKM